MRLKNDYEYLTFDDVLLEPGLSLESRKDANVSQNIPCLGHISHPIIPANMDSVSGQKMCEVALANGGIAILHRFMPFEERVKIWTTLNRNDRLFLSVGVSDEEFKMVEALHKTYGCKRFCIDIAHGHSERVKKLIEYIRQLDSELIQLASKYEGYPEDYFAKSVIIAGNVATIDGYSYLRFAGADIIKVGIGPGSHCTTRIVTGCGVPQLSAIAEIVKYKQCCQSAQKEKLTFPLIIADGGIRSAGDITKALAAGADLVMTGSLFAGCPEAPGEELAFVGGERYKNYRGMASKDAQITWRGEDKDIVPEGEASLVKMKPPFQQVLHQLVGGLKSGMSYVGCKTIKEMQEKATFIKVSSNTLIENRPHGKQ